MTSSSTLRRALGALGASAILAALASAPAHAAIAATDTTSCVTPAFSQPFSAYKDQHQYTLAPGGTYDDQTGGGWELSGGAGILPALQSDGTIGGVLDLPSRSSATSPALCITSDYPNARAWVRNLAGAEGVFFYVSYFVGGAWTTPKNTGQFHGDHAAWTLAKPMNVQPGKSPGWQLARFTFIAGGTTSHFQVDDFWVDPRLRM